MEELPAVTKSLQRVIESLVELGVVTSESATNDPTGDLVQRKVAGYINDAKAAKTASETLGNVQIPLDILAYIDDGRNPDVYSREFVELVTKQNQSVAGQIEGLKQFQTVLSMRVVEQFPDLKRAVEQLQ